MTAPALQFDTSDRIGRVAAVDTSKVLIDVEEPTLMTRIGVGNLIAVRGATEREFLIGITERLTRCLREEMLDGKTDEKELLAMGPQPDDAIRVVLVGTFRTIQGDKPNVFKRGADSFPQIEPRMLPDSGYEPSAFHGLARSGRTRKRTIAAWALCH